MTDSTTQATSAPAKKANKVLTFFEHIGEWFDDHFGEGSSFAQKAALAISVIAPLVQEVVALATGTTAASKVTGVATQATNDLNNIAAILNGAETTGGVTLQSLFASVQTNLGTLLTDADVKNSGKQAEITGAVNTILGEIEAVADAIPDDFVHTPTGTTAAPVTK